MTQYWIHKQIKTVEHTILNRKTNYTSDIFQVEDSAHSKDIKYTSRTPFAKKSFSQSRSVVQCFKQTQSSRLTPPRLPIAYTSKILHQTQHPRSPLPKSLRSNAAAEIKSLDSYTHRSRHPRRRGLTEVSSARARDDDEDWRLPEVTAPRGSIFPVATTTTPERWMRAKFGARENNVSRSSRGVGRGGSSRSLRSRQVARRASFSNPARGESRPETETVILQEEGCGRAR